MGTCAWGHRWHSDLITTRPCTWPATTTIRLAADWSTVGMCDVHARAMAEFELATIVTGQRAARR